MVESGPSFNMHPPQIFLRFEDSKFKQTTVLRQQLGHLSQGAMAEVDLKLDRSFGDLLVQIEDVKGIPAVFVNGGGANPRLIGNIYELRIPLNRDLMFQRIAVVVPPIFSLTVNLYVEHHYRPRGWQGKEGVVKWSLDRFRKEFEKYSELFSNLNQNSYLEDTLNFGFVGGAEKSEQTLVKIIGNIDLLLSTVSPNEAAIDFHISVDEGFDVGGIISDIKQAPQRLSYSENGIINFKGNRYSTTINRRVSHASHYVDFSDVVDLLEYCASRLIKSSMIPALGLMLKVSTSILKQNYPSKEGVADIKGNILEREMRSAFGGSLQHNLRILVAVINGLVKRARVDLDLQWITLAIQDRDVFEKSVFACCAKALGFSHEDVIKSNGLLLKGGIVVADTNSRAGAAQMNFVLKSWRQGSAQPSNYHPDTLIISDGIPVLIDAKFRLPESVFLAAEPDGLKDVQAYMDDFSLSSAVIVVPRILCREILGPNGFVTIEGNNKKIYIAEMQDSDCVIAQYSLKIAISLVAEYASNQVT